MAEYTIIIKKFKKNDFSIEKSGDCFTSIELLGILEVIKAGILKYDLKQSKTKKK